MEVVLKMLATRLALMGFFTKFGDGAADILPLAGLTKRRVRAIVEHIGAPPELVFKVPTADLESDAPLRPDEDAYGVTYEEIDDFLEGKPISELARLRILKTYQASGTSAVYRLYRSADIGCFALDDQGFDTACELPSVRAIALCLMTEPASNTAVPLGCRR